MHIENRFVENCVILDVTDEQFEYPKTSVLKSHVLHLIQEGHVNLVLNLTNVKMLDSFGIATFISILKECKSRNGSLALYGLNDTVNRLMEITHMDRVLEIWLTEAQALYQFQKTTRGRNKQILPD
jgi:anti-sigma B factor antagonist